MHERAQGSISLHAWLNLRLPSIKVKGRRSGREACLRLALDQLRSIGNPAVLL